MTASAHGRAWRRRIQPGFVAIAAMAAMAFPLSLTAQDFGFGYQQPFYPGNLVVSRSVYDNRAGNVMVGQALPPNCPPLRVAVGDAETAVHGTRTISPSHRC